MVADLCTGNGIVLADAAGKDDGIHAAHSCNVAADGLFDLVCLLYTSNKQKPGDYDDEIRRLGGHIYQSPGLNPLHYPAYLRFVQQLSLIHI